MKKQFSLFLFGAALFALPAMGATNWGAQAGSTADLTGAPATRSNPANVNYEKYETRSTTRTYSNSGVRNTGNAGAVNYTAQPSTRTQMYRSYNDGATTTTRTATNSRTQTVRTSMKRKYYLAHPFFQPTEGKFGSITDLGYNRSSYDIDFIPSGTMSDTSAKWEARSFTIKEDLSYGITDKLGVLLMGRYDFSKYKFDWSNAPDDTMDDNGLNIFGAGLQWRFVDNEKWIATISGYYERQKDIANDFVLDFKAGYKVSKSTIYGLLRGWLINFDDEYYGNGITGETESGAVESLFIAYDDDAKTTFFIEGGLGVFSVLDEDWTLNLEAILGHYDWHNQASIKGAIGWQPNDWFALNLYAKTSFYDTAEGKKLDFYGTESGVWHDMGKAKLDKYNEMSFGGQIIFYF